MRLGLASSSDAFGSARASDAALNSATSAFLQTQLYLDLMENWYSFSSSDTFY